MCLEFLFIHGFLFFWFGVVLQFLVRVSFLDNFSFLKHKTSLAKFFEAILGCIVAWLFKIVLVYSMWDTWKVGLLTVTFEPILWWQNHLYLYLSCSNIGNTYTYMQCTFVCRNVTNQFCPQAFLWKLRTKFSIFVYVLLFSSNFTTIILILFIAALRHVVFRLPAGFFLPVGLVPDFDYFLSRASTGWLVAS